MKLIVSGCSMTHGAELYNNFMHPENVKLSYSQHLANKLNLNLINVALSAGSNEYIFHSLIDAIEKNTNVHSVVVMWTTTGRLYWQCNNRHYFFLGNFASSMKDLVNFKMHDVKLGDCWFTGDNDEIVGKIANIHKFIVTDYFDREQELIKLNHYKTALSAVCKNQNIKLIDIDWNFISDLITTGHPNADQHKTIAERIYKTYYEENKQ